MWLKKLYDRFRGLKASRQKDVVTLTLPSGHKVSLSQEDYELYLGGNYVIIWRFTDPCGSIIHWHNVHTLGFTDIMVWTGRREERIATGVRNGAWGLHPYPHPSDHEKRQAANPDYLPYDPRLGF